MTNLNSPLPTDLATECRKAAKTLNSFVKPNAKTGPDSAIPPNIIASAKGTQIADTHDNIKGLAILTVIKAGFLWSGRMGTGIVVARLPDGSWSAPSAIGTAGVGFGGQIGAELTDFVIILNTPEAVAAFSLGGNVTLGMFDIKGNLSVAAGPIGRNAEAAGTVGKLSAIFSYSKTKGLFAGVSLEGSVILERKDANAEQYHRKISAKEILSGSVERPPAASELYRALELRSGSQSPMSATSPVSPVYGAPPAYQTPAAAVPGARAVPVVPTRPKNNADTVIALYDFKGERPDDLSFRKGDLINLVSKTDSQNDWWVGSINGKTGNFPANYTRAP